MLQFDFLSNLPEAVPIVGRWYHQAWGHPQQGESEESSIAGLEIYLNNDRIPFILVASEQKEILAAAQLKYREMADIFPEKEHWIGGLVVAPGHRGRGIASRLVQEIMRIAPLYGVKTLYLQTEQLDGGLYARLGWQAFQQVNIKGLKVLVMQQKVG